MFRYIGEQGDDIVVCHLFDFMDPIQFKISLGLDVMKSIIRDNTQFVHGFTGKNLNLDHGPVFIFFLSRWTPFLYPYNVESQYFLLSKMLPVTLHDNTAHRYGRPLIVSFFRTSRNDFSYKNGTYLDFS